MSLNALRQVGPVKLILAHMGGWRNWDQVEQLLPHTSVCLDTSFSLGDMHPAPDGFYRPEELHMMGPEQFTRMVRLFGHERIFFGTDCPWGGQKAATPKGCWAWSDLHLSFQIHTFSLAGVNKVNFHFRGLKKVKNGV